MQGSVFLSVLLHVLFLALTVLGLPTFSRPVEVPLTIDVELAEIEEPAPEAPVIPPPPPVPKNDPKPLDSPPPPPPEHVAAASPPEPETLDVPAEALPPPPKPASATALPPKPEPTRSVAPKAEASPPSPEPAVAPLPPDKTAPPEPPVETAAASPAQAPALPPPPPQPPSRFDNMLRDLSERVPAPPADEPPKPDDTIERYAQLDPPPASVVEDSPEQRFVRARIYGIIQKQIQANWRRPPALQEVEDMSVILDFQLQPDGTIHDLHISEAERNRIDSNALLQPLLDSAQAAIMRTGQIRGLPPENYATWRRVRLNFKPQH